MNTLAGIHSYLREASRPFREIIQIGPFCATFTPDSDHLYVNYAIPDDGAEPSGREIEEFVTASIQRNRIPRFEYIPQLAPAVEPALRAAGFIEERRCPVMTCVPGDVTRVELADGFEVVIPTTDSEISGLVNALNEAYGESPLAADALAKQCGFIRKLSDQGGISVLAREVSIGQPAGGGSCTVPVSGVTEVAGIGVREPFRRRGIGQAITTFLAEEAFNRGITLAFLSAATEREAQIYARAGFKHVGELLLISRPQTR